MPPISNVTDDDVTVTAKIARAHLNEFPDYYSSLAIMEAEMLGRGRGPRLATAPSVTVPQADVTARPAPRLPSHRYRDA